MHISGVLACHDETCGREERTYDGGREHTPWRVNPAGICMGQYLDWFIPLSPKRWKRADGSEGFISTAMRGAAHRRKIKRSRPFFFPLFVPRQEYPVFIAACTQRDPRSRVLRAKRSASTRRYTTDDDARLQPSPFSLSVEHSSPPTPPWIPRGIYGPVRKVRLHLLRVSPPWLFLRARSRNRDVALQSDCSRLPTTCPRFVVNVYSLRGNLGETS